MNLQQLEKRVADLAKAVEESAARHNMLCGHKAEAEYMLGELKKVAECDQPAEGVVESKD